MLLVSLLLAVAALQADTVLQPAAAIARANATPSRCVNATFEMKVAIAARTLPEKLGADPAMALIGRTVGAKGSLRLVPIVNTINGTTRSYNRVQHGVLVRSPDKLTVE